MKQLSQGTMYGLLFLVVLTFLVHTLATIPFIHELRLSPMVLGVVVGMILANTLRPRLPESWDGGLKIASKQLLRAGIVLYGFRLTYDTILQIGGGAIIIDIIIVVGTLLIGNYLGRALGLDKDERLLIAVDVWLSTPLPCWTLRCSFPTRCRNLHGLYRARSGTRRRSRCGYGSRDRRDRYDDQDATCAAPCPCLDGAWLPDAP